MATNVWSDSVSWTYQEILVEPVVDSGKIPDNPNDSATISVNTSVSIDANHSIGQLTISNNADLTNANAGSNYSLSVFRSLAQPGLLLIGGAGSNFGLHDSPSSVDLRALMLQIDSGGQLYPFGSTIQVDDTLDLNAGGTISGRGLIEMTSAVGGSFINDGLIQSSGGTLTLSRTGGSVTELDMDGSGGDGSLRALDNSVLTIDIPLSDPIFNGTMTVGEDAELQINNLWTLSGSSGTQLELNGGAGTATLSGALITSSGRINANSGTVAIAADLQANSGRVAAHSTLRLEGTANIEAGAELTLNDIGSALVVQGSTTINQPTFEYSTAELSTRPMVRATLACSVRRIFRSGAIQH